MKTRRILSIFFLAFTLVAAACSDDTGGNGGVINPANNLGGDEDADTTAPDAGDDAGEVADADNADADTTDSGADTGPDVSVPGFLHGTWLVKEGDTTLATLVLAHEQGQTTLTGTYDMAVPADAEGNLSGTTWLNDETFTTNWFADIDGSERQFGISQATKTDDDTLSDGRFLDGTTGGFRDVILVRQ